MLGASLSKLVSTMATHAQDGPSPLMYAICYGHTGVAKTLLQFGADCNYSSIVSGQLVCLPRCACGWRGVWVRV